VAAEGNTMTEPQHDHDDAITRASDLETLLAEPDFSGNLMTGSVRHIGTRLPLLDEVAGVTVAGPVMINDVASYDPPVESGGPIRCRPGRISLRIDPHRLDSVVVSDPSSHGPGMMRMFDTSGRATHITYVTNRSDHQEFGILRSMSPSPMQATTGVSGNDLPRTAAGWAEADQVTLFDSILDDGGMHRNSALRALGDHGCIRVDTRRVIAAMSQLAITGLPATVAVAGGGCIQMRQAQIDGAREHRGSMVIASDACRMLVDFNLITECWVTRTHGVWGHTSSIELYDRRAHCVLVLTQTGTVARSAHTEWEYMMESVAS
jgi:putative hemin transport protein